MANTETHVLDREELRRIVAGALDVDTTDIGDDTRFVDELEVDSLMALEILVVLEKTYGIKLVEDDLQRIDTLDSAHRLLTAKLAG